MNRDDINCWMEIVGQLDSVFRMLLPMREADRQLDIGDAAGIVGNARDRLHKYLIEQSRIGTEANYEFCLEMTLKERLPHDYITFIDAAKKMQERLTEGQKFGMLRAV